MQHNHIIEWPNGNGHTYCSAVYRELLDEKQAIETTYGSINIDEYSPEDYNRWNTLVNDLATLQMNGHVGNSERY